MKKQLGWKAHTLAFLAICVLVLLSYLLVPHVFAPWSRLWTSLLFAGLGAWLMVMYLMNLAEQQSSGRLTMVIPLLLVTLLITLAVLDPLSRQTYPSKVLAPTTAGS
jgi:heme/copper-type cytochrome/quinol oxidase subunit 4